MWMFAIWSLAGVVAAGYCLTRAVIDLRSGKYVWGIIGLASAMVFLLTPVQTHAVRIDLPATRP